METVIAAYALLIGGLAVLLVLAFDDDGQPPLI